MGILGDLINVFLGAVLAFAGLAWYGDRQKKRGKEEAEDDAMRDAYNRVEQGRQSVRDADPDRDGNDQLRDNSGHW